MLGSLSVQTFSYNSTEEKTLFVLAKGVSDFT